MLTREFDAGLLKSWIGSVNEWRLGRPAPACLGMPYSSVPVGWRRDGPFFARPAADGALRLMMLCLEGEVMPLFVRPERTADRAEGGGCAVTAYFSFPSPLTDGRQPVWVTLGETGRASGRWFDYRKSPVRGPDLYQFGDGVEAVGKAFAALQSVARSDFCPAVEADEPVVVSALAR